MLRKILPIVLALIGLGAGVGAGLALRPPPEDPLAAAANAPAADPHQLDPGQADASGGHGDAAGGAPTSEFVKLNNQFIVPVVRKGQVASMVILSLSLEVHIGGAEAVYRAEPKLRDAFLQVLFDHANIGGFDGNFTGSAKMDELRKALTETAHVILGDTILNVLISDIVRQDS